MESGDLSICRNCVGDTYLKKQIAEQGDPGECSYCNADEAVVELDWLADQVRAALDAHYIHTPPEPYDLPLEWIKEGFWEREGEPIVSVIAEMLEVDETPIASDVRKNLDDRFSDWDLAKMGVEE